MKLNKRFYINILLTKGYNSHFIKNDRNENIFVTQSGTFLALDLVIK